MSWNSQAERRCAARPVPSLRRIALAAGSAAVLTACLAGAFTGAVAGPADAATGRTAAAGQHGKGLKVTIDSVSPDIGRPGRAVTVTGQVSNDGRGTVQGLTADLRSSGSGLQYRGALDEYATGTSSADQQVTPAVNLPDLGPGRSEGFRMSFRPDDAGIQQFGVYPLAAEINEASGATVTARTFLPFWPPSQQGVQKLKIAWVWPLIDQPRQGACPALLNNTLAGSLDAASGGRLGGLLQAGRSDGHGARITWAVDPALLADTEAMTSQYHVLDGPRCRNLRTVPASAGARQWLASLSSTVTQGQGGQPVFTTPYADVDVAALTHAGLDTDLGNAFSTGQSAATSALGQRLDRAGGTRKGTAWPPGGAADSSVLDNLAVNGVRTAVLDSNEMPPANQVDYTPDAVTKVPSGVGSDVRVLLSDHTLTGVLGRSGAAAGSSPAQTEQWFLAETAMIAAEAPQLGRSVVVAPPPRWSPSQALAEGLLSETTSAPWLQPGYLNDLAPAPAPASVARTPLPASQTSPSELGSGYLTAVKPIDASVQRFNSILSRPDPLYPEAVARAESSAWRGSGQEAGRDLTSQVGRYVADQEAKVRVLSSPGVTLSGGRGNVPVSLVNQLPRGYTATVKLEAAAEANKRVPAAGRLMLGNKPGPFVQTVTISAGESMTVRIPVHAQSAGLTDVDLRLLAPNGAPLSAKPTVLKVQSTPLGLVAEVITGVAVGVLVLTSLVRVVRRGLREGRPSPAGPARGVPAHAGEPPQQPPSGDQQEPSPAVDTREPSWSGDAQQPGTGDPRPPWSRDPHDSSPAVDPHEPSWPGDPHEQPWPGDPHEQPWPGDPQEPSRPGNTPEPSWQEDPQEPSWPGNPQQPWPGDPQQPSWPGNPQQPWPGDPQQPSWPGDPQQPSRPGNTPEPSWQEDPQEPPWPRDPHQPWPADPQQPSWSGPPQEPWPGDAQQGPSAPSDRRYEPPPSTLTERGADQAGPARVTGGPGAGGASGASGDAFAPPDEGDQAGFSSGHGAGHEAGTVVSEDGRPASQHAQHFPEEPDEFADARPRAWPDAP